MITINKYSFGNIVVDGKKYNSDIIIYPERVQTDWWRKEGHSLCIEDIEEVLKAKPEVIIVGCGASGIMDVAVETRALIEAKGIKLIQLPTDKACEEYNVLAKTQKVIACLHLTC